MTDFSKRSKGQQNYLKLAVLNAYDYEDKRTNEIAKELGISENEVVLILEKAGRLH